MFNKRFIKRCVSRRLANGKPFAGSTLVEYRGVWLEVNKTRDFVFVNSFREMTFSAGSVFEAETMVDHALACGFHLLSEGLCGALDPSIDGSSSIH